MVKQFSDKTRNPIYPGFGSRHSEESQQNISNQIGIHLLDSIKLKATLERFRRQFSKSDLLKRLILAHLQGLRSRVHSHDYALVDITDIQKRYSRFQEGLARLQDGSK